MTLSFILVKLQLFFLQHGEFKIVEGASAEFPEPPKNVRQCNELGNY